MKAPTETDAAPREGRSRLPNLHYRWLFPALIFGGMTLPLLLLAYENDESMAGIFHDYASAWAVAMHVAILLFPVAIATLPRQDKRLSDRNVAWAVWGIALVLALIGNIVGSVAHASDRTIREVLNGAPTTASGFVQLVAGLGGFLIIALEFASGRLLESNVARLFFGPSPDDIMPTPPRPPTSVQIARAALSSSGRRHRLPPFERPRLTAGQAVQDVQDRGRPASKTPRPQSMDGPVRRRGRVQRPASMDGAVQVAVQTSVQAPVQPSIELSTEMIAAVRAYASTYPRSYRLASEVLAGEGHVISKSSVGNLVARAREIDPTWCAALLGEA